MRIRPLTAAVAAATIGLAIFTTACSEQEADWRQPVSKDWPLMGGDWGNTRYATLDDITVDNIKELGGAWVRDFKGEYSRGTPIVWDGLMFIHTGTHVYAVNPKTGDVVWTLKPDVPPETLTKGLAVGEGLLFVGVSDASIIAIKQKTGEVVWKQALGDKPAGEIELTGERWGGQWVGGSPTYAEGLVFGGLSGAMAPVDRNDGRVVAVNAKTGEVVWTTHMIPGPGEPGHETWPQDSDVWKKGGAAVWITPAVDPDLGLVYVATGNAIPEVGGQVREGDNLYTASILALEIKTGKIKWYYQLTRHEIWEHDLGTSPILYDAIVDGKTRKAVGIMRTDGYLFLLDRADGKPVLPIEERPVPQSIELKTARTQPFPVGDQVGPNCVQKDMVPPGFELGCYFDVITTDRPSLLTPFITTLAAPLSFSPQTGYFYVTGSVFPQWMRLWEDPYVFTAVHAIPFVKSYGLLAAIDSKTNRIVWQKQLPNRIEGGSGVTTTAGGLMFHGEPNGNLQAYNAKTGDLLWEFQTGANVGGTVTTYEIDGEQYVATIATGALWAFKLGGTVAPRPAPEPPPAETTFRGRITAADTIMMGAELSDVRNIKYTDEYIFMPTRVSATVGGKITWTNAGKVPHEAMAVDGSWTTGEVAPGKWR
jgi:quinohemoprotein ethanol dehydrogenase